MPELHVLGIAGSLRSTSYNRGLLRAASGAVPAGVRVESAEIGSIPGYNADFEENPPTPVTELAAKIRGADAVLLVTPEYNFSIPGVLKNTIDWVSRAEVAKGPAFRGKPVGILGASTGPLGSARAQYDLRRVMQSLEAYPMPRPELFVSFAPKKFDSQGELTDDETRHALTKWLAAFVVWTERVRSWPPP
ncbi:MAG: NAD(P)H-dependent oxidoreductase [Thermoplasmata archaeon]|nr:NAD(P)H-dependent oxidoreductase [Thermoplasmata archaeon]